MSPRTGNPRTVLEVLQLLEDYHQQRHDIYNRLADAGDDARAELLLRHLVELEANAIRIIQDEIKHVQGGPSAYLSSGPTLSIKPAHAMDCQCGDHPSYADALRCALSSDDALDELIDRLSGSSAAASVQNLAARLREVERTKDRQIANFTRDD